MILLHSSVTWALTLEQDPTKLSCAALPHYVHATEDPTEAGMHRRAVAF